MGPARIYPWRRMHPSRALSIAPGTFFVAQSWAGCITNMPGFNLRQAQPGKRLGAVIVGVEFVGRQPVIRGGRKPDDQGHAQHKEHEQRLGMASSKCEAEFRPRTRAVAIHPFKRHALSLIGCMTTHWCRPECGGNSRGGIASHLKLSD